MEYCDAGDLAQYLQKYRVLPEQQAQIFLSQLANALNELWKQNLIHRDIKPQNILLCNERGSLVLKLADFGFARIVRPADLAETLCGSPLYMAPEILKYEKYDSKADLWSIGAIAYEMLFGQPPFRGENHIHLLRVIENTDESKLHFPTRVLIQSRSNRSASQRQMIGKKSVSTALDIHASFEAKQLIKGLLVKDPSKRMNFIDFFNHPFLQVIEKSNIVPASLPSSRSSLHQRTASSVSNISIVSFDLGLQDLLACSIDDGLVLDSLFAATEAHQPAIFTSLRSIVSMVLVLEKILTAESSVLLSQSLTMSISKYSQQPARKIKYANVLVILRYLIDLLEHAYLMVKLSVTKHESSSIIMLKLARWITQKMDQMFDMLDSIKSPSLLASSLSRSTSSSSIGLEENEVSPSIESILYSYSCSFAKEAGIQELLDNHQEANSLYLIANFILQFLLKPCQTVPVVTLLANINQPDEHQKLNLSACSDKLQERLILLQNK